MQRPAKPSRPVRFRPQPSPNRAINNRLQEQERLLEECQRYSNPMLYWIVVLAIETGMHKSEMVTLTRHQIFRSA